MGIKERFEKVLAAFAEHNKNAASELDYATPFELLVAVILSAQCTDKRVNMVTPALFKAYPTAYELAQATPEQVLPYISSVSYPNSKSEHLVTMARQLVNDFGGEVPQTLEELTSLAGVGRKTANVLLVIAFGQAAMPVDTHVFRVSERLGLTRGATTPLAAERQLVRYIPQEQLGAAHHWILLHGRYICKSRKPLCEQCYLTPYCNYFTQQVRITSKK